MDVAKSMTRWKQPVNVLMLGIQLHTDQNIYNYLCLLTYIVFIQHKSVLVWGEPYINIALLFTPFPLALMVAYLYVENCVFIIIREYVILNCCGWK